MITVAGFNTSIDKFLGVDALQAGGIARAHTVNPLPGGKGLHVALTIAELGEPVRLVGLIDKNSRAFFEDFLAERKVEFVGIEVDHPVRTCLSIVDDAGTVTEIREAGPTVDNKVHTALCDAALDDHDLLVLSGSVPPGSPDTTYAELVRRNQNSRTLVDASGRLLQNAAAAKPFCIKPNKDETAALLGSTVQSVEQAAAALPALRDKGISLPLISLGAEGLLAGTDDGVLHVRAPQREAKNPVGSGDCLVGGLAVGIKRGLPLPEALHLGVACGTANVLTHDIGIIQKADVDTVLPDVTSERIGA